MTNLEKRGLADFVKYYASHGYGYKEIERILLGLKFKKSTIRAYYKTFRESK